MLSSSVLPTSELLLALAFPKAPHSFSGVVTDFLHVCHLYEIVFHNEDAIVNSIGIYVWIKDPKIVPSNRIVATYDNVLISFDPILRSHNHVIVVH